LPVATALADFGAAAKLHVVHSWMDVVLENRCYGRATLGQTRQGLEHCNEAFAQFPEFDLGCGNANRSDDRSQVRTLHL
jgi:hypothetical protein